MTPANVKTLIRDQVNESSSSFWSDAEIFRYMWAAEILLADETNSTVKVGTAITTTTGTIEYTKNTDVVNILKVTYDGYPLQKINIKVYESVAGITYGSTATQGKPAVYYELGSSIGLYPTPDDAKSIKIYYVFKPTLKTDASTAFDIPAQLSPLIPDYALYRMYQKDGEENRSTFHKREWELNLIKAKKQWDERENLGANNVVKDAEQNIETEWGLV